MQIEDIRFEPYEKFSGWFRSEQAAGDFVEVEQRALALQSEAQRRGFYAICGMFDDDGYSLFLLPRIGVKGVIETFGIGSHADEDPQGVYREVEAADIRNPLVPYFADAAGLKAKFSFPLTSEVIALLQENVLHGETMWDEECSLSDYVEKNQGIHLWWD